MNYLLDRRKKKKRILNIALVVVAIFLVIYFSTPISKILSRASHAIFRPFVSFGNSIQEKISITGAYFYSKKFLLLENENLKTKLDVMKATVSNYNTILDENSKLKEILNRKKERTEFILSEILSKPNQSLYDTLIIDTGERQGISLGSLVFAYGNVPIGRVNEVYPRSSKIKLFSTPGEKTEVIIGGRDTFMQIVGRGGGNFEMVLPRDFSLERGAEVHLPGIDAFVLATVDAVISDPRDAFQKALLVSPVNFQELKFVEVEK